MSDGAPWSELNEAEQCAAFDVPKRIKELEAENARLKARAEAAEQTLRDTIAAQEVQTKALAERERLLAQALWALDIIHRAQCDNEVLQAAAQLVPRMVAALRALGIQPQEPT